MVLSDHAGQSKPFCLAFAQVLFAAIRIDELQARYLTGLADHGDDQTPSPVTRRPWL